MWSCLLGLALLLLPAPALADVKEKVAALVPAGVVLVVDAEGNELVAQNIDEPFVPASVTTIVTAWLARSWYVRQGTAKSNGFIGPSDGFRESF